MNAHGAERTRGAAGRGEFDDRDLDRLAAKSLRLWLPELTRVSGTCRGSFWYARTTRGYLPCGARFWATGFGILATGRRVVSYPLRCATMR
jgi:hypothetical protein